MPSDACSARMNAAPCICSLSRYRLFLCPLRHQTVEPGSRGHRWSCGGRYEHFPSILVRVVTHDLSSASALRLVVGPEVGLERRNPVSSASCCALRAVVNFPCLSSIRESLSIVRLATICPCLPSGLRRAPSSQLQRLCKPSSGRKRRNRLSTSSTCASGKNPEFTVRSYTPQLRSILLRIST